MSGAVDVASIQAYYARRVTERVADTEPCCGTAASCCAPAAPTGSDDVDAGAVLRDLPSFGCGDPTASAGMVAGETVLDLGSGAGLDALRAAEAVGPSGRVVGVDMTPAMLSRARAAATRLGLGHVEFREGFIEALPVADASVDLVISNCVINLSADKGAVFREIERVLRPGGRLRVSDILVSGAHARPATTDGWCGCVDGAITAGTYATHARRAGLVDVTVVPSVPPVAAGATYAAIVTARKPDIGPADDAATADGEALLAGAGLPTDGFRDAATLRLALREGGRTLGVVALERHGGEVLLRSLAVSPEVQGRAYGSALVAAGLRWARATGTTRVHALTTTIPDWLLRLGFVERTRADVPAVLHASAELRGACPASARVFARDLDPMAVVA